MLCVRGKKSRKGARRTEATAGAQKAGKHPIYLVITAEERRAAPTPQTSEPLIRRAPSVCGNETTAPRERTSGPLSGGPHQSAANDALGQREPGTEPPISRRAHDSPISRWRPKASGRRDDQSSRSRRVGRTSGCRNEPAGRYPAGPINPRRRPASGAFTPNSSNSRRPAEPKLPTATRASRTLGHSSPEA